MDPELKALVKIGIPVMLATLGYVGFSFAKDDPDLTPKRFMGGVITAGFVAWGVSTLLNNMGIPSDLSSVCGAVIGSQGPAGAYLLINKVQRIFDHRE
jgi:hypothetical protein